ncbi:uncharacterized protein BXZ73DRAFT_56398 [Epithele typhae]|uniref:uncharacterized protein n=1 Tax=Epithele typhae TaxID=378194 RepID=UPI002008618F|nr:uncharacterized protein BXZ73DRAFT_56398 [Epithele typhae]KAH9912249.1 hypothetical protein BXZ73DRAFT_56398 [Epithele typhae]
MAAISGRPDDPKLHLTQSGHATPRTAARPGTVLNEFVPDVRPVIAIDFDDVLCKTNHAVAAWHNDAHGTKMALDDFYYYYYWMNPYWGNPDETVRKVEEIWKSDYLDRADPVEGAAEGLAALAARGFRLVLVTARQPRELERSLGWLDKHMPGLIDTMICTGQSQETLADEKELVTKLSKAEVCRRLGAKLMVDDSAENALKCAVADPPVPVVLFGEYEWNKRVGRYSDVSKETSFEDRLAREGGREFWKEESLEKELPPGAPLYRVKDWEALIDWVDKQREEGRI